MHRARYSKEGIQIYFNKRLFLYINVNIDILVTIKISQPFAKSTKTIHHVYDELLILEKKTKDWEMGGEV